MRSKRVVAIVASSALTLMMVTATGRASADDPASSAPATPVVTLGACETPPDNTDATAANRDAFVQRWMARISDKAWFQSFANSGTLPGNIASEPEFAMGKDTQAWLISCLVDTMLSTAGKTETPDGIQKLQIGLDLVIFGKSQLQDMREKLSSTDSSPTHQTPPTPANLSSDAVKAAESRLLSQPSLTSAGMPKANATTPTVTTSSNLAGSASDRLQSLVGANTKTSQSKVTKNNVAVPNATGVNPNVVLNKLSALDGIITSPIVAFLLQALQNLLALIANIQQILFTIPGVNLLAAAFYRVCAESATMSLRCSILLPVGVPNFIDVTGDNFPDMIADLTPLLNTTSVGAKVYFAKIAPASQPVPAHMFIVYDTPFVKKRIEFGFDGRASSLAKQSTTTVWARNILKALTGDVQVTADINSISPGSTESMTFAIKDLVGGSTGVPPSEANPTAGAVQFSPFPTTISADAHFVHTSAQDEDTINLTTSAPSTVNALVTQDTTTTTPKSHREFTALIDQLPTSVNVDLLHQGEKQTITYTANAPIAHVHASDTATPDTSHPGSFTATNVDVVGVPASFQLELLGAKDIKYVASSSIPQATFTTQTQKDGVLQQEITGQVNSVPSTIHVANTTSADQTRVTYDANSVLGSILLSMYDLNQDKTNLVASAFGIPQHIEFTQTKSTGVLDFVANAGISQINVDFTRADGTILPLSGDHVTVHKVGAALGLQLQLSGFKSAHFDGSQKTIVSLGLDPGGQEFNALADMDSPNILANVHISELPSLVNVTIDPVSGAVTYSADRVIPELDGSFLKRDTQTFGGFTLLGLPKNIQLTFNTTGVAPEITYEADSRLTSIEGTYQKAPGDLSFHALISDLPQFMRIHGQDPTVFDARTSSTDPIGTSFLGQVRFDYATDGAFQHAITPDDHVLLNTVGGQTHAELVYTGLKYLSVDTTNQALHAEVRNESARLIRAFITTDNLTATAFIDKVPAKVQVDQVGNDIQYHASSSIDEIFTNVARAGGDTIQVDVLGVPNFIDVVFDAANSKIDWTANDTTDSISAIAHLTPATLGTTRGADAELTISGIPKHWFVTYPNGNVDFEASGSGIGSIDAKVTNHTTYHTLAGDHLNAFFDQTVGSAPGDLDASLHISNLTKAAFTKLTDSSGGGFVADLNMGNHGLFNFGAQINLGTNVLNASGNFTHLPSTIHLSSDGGRIIYNGNDNPTLTLTLAAGNPTALASTPLAPSVHGVSVRDGISSGNRAVRANLFITGLPDHLDLNSPATTYTVDGFHPTQDPLVVDAKLTTLAARPVSLLVQQNVGLASPVDFTFGPFLSSTDGAGNHKMSINYTASRDLGSFTAEVGYGNSGDPTSDDAKLFISEIPGGTAPSIAVNATFGQDQKLINLAMTHDIGQITASYKHVGDAMFAASADLTSVPKTVNLTIGRGSASGGGKTISAPDLDYTADHAGLNIAAFATAAISDPADITAAVTLTVTNIGQHVTGTLDGTKLHITSSPATGSFLLLAAATIAIDVPLDFSAGPFINEGNLHVDSNISELKVAFTNASDIGLELGITSGLTGDFSSFTLGEKSDTNVRIDDEFFFELDLDVFGTVHIGIVSAHATLHLGNIIGAFHLNSNTDGFLSLLHLSALLAHCDIGINYRPKSEFTTPVSELTVGPPPYDGHDPAAWLITPVLSLLEGIMPDFAYDVIAFFASPYGNSISPGIDCDFGP